MRVIPKKSLGQNFLRSQAVARVIAEAACPVGDETVLEIGPGEGMLTDELLARAEKVVAIEKDARLIPMLREKYAKEIKEKKLVLKEGDVLLENSRKLEKLIGVKKYVVAANIPYYITGIIIRRLLEERVKPARITLLVQKEVAERIVARDGKESILSTSVKVYGVPRIIRKVPAGAFHPRPSVDSAVILIENIKDPFTKKFAEKKFFEILKRGFAHKRKLLRRNLGVSEEILSACGIGTTARPEDLSPDKWLCLSRTTDLANKDR